MTQQLKFIRNGGETRRYHTWPVLRQQNVAEHSFNVAMICSWLARQETPGIGAALLMAALTHDLAEHQMGDLPAPVKRALPDYAEGTFREVWGGLENKMLIDQGLDWEQLLSDKEKHWLKLADAAEGCFYCIREREMGNRLIDEVYNNFIDYCIKEFNGDSETEASLIRYIDAEWVRVVS